MAGDTIIVEPYDASLGCLAIRRGDKWLVITPDGRVAATFDDEHRARDEAMYRNLTVTPEEEERWRSSFAVAPFRRRV